jgi:hypothetical protein
MIATALPPPETAWPAERAKLAAVRWGHTHLTLCPTCQGPALVGWLDGEPVAYACHRCGPFTSPPQPQSERGGGVSAL